MYHAPCADNVKRLEQMCKEFESETDDNKQNDAADDSNCNHQNVQEDDVFYRKIYGA